MQKQDFHLLEVKHVAELLSVPVRTLLWQIKSKKINSETSPSRGKTGFKYLIHLSSLPPSAQAEYLKQQGLMPMNQAERRFTLHNRISPASNSQLDILPSWAEGEALAKADLIHAWLKEKEKTKKRGLNISQVHAIFLEAYNTGFAYPLVFEVLGNVSRGTLYRWEKVYSESGKDFTALAPDWGGKRGLNKVTNDEANILLSQLLHQNRIKVETAINLTKYILKRRGLPSPSSNRTLRRYIDNFKKRHYDLWVALREGEKALNDKVLPFLKRDSSLLEVGDVLVADGHRLNFQVINPYTGKPCRAVLVGFYDWASRDLLGYEIMVEENTQAVAGAMRNAILELGKFPKAVLMDNGKAFKAKVFTSDLSFDECGFYGMFARLGIITSFAWPYNAQSKPIERFFGTFSDSFERLMPSFTGASIEDKPAYMRRNEKFLKSLHKDWVPTIPEAMALIAQWREYYRSQPHSGLKGRTPGEVLNAGRGPGIDARVLDYLMLSMEIVTIGRNGIRFMGNEYFHEALYGFREKVVIRYSFFDLSQVFIYTTKGEYLCTASMVQPVHPMARLTGNPVTMDKVKEGQRQKRALKRQTMKVIKMAKDTVGDLALPWNEIVSTVPRIAEHVEALEANIRMDKMSVADNLVRSGGSEANGLYKSDYDKYLALKNRQELSPDERSWQTEYEARLASYV